MNSKQADTKITLDDLKLCHALKQEAQEMMQQIQSLKSLAQKATSCISSSGVKSSSAAQDGMARTISAYMDLEKSYEECICRCFEHNTIVELAVETLKNPNHRRILRLRYMEAKTWDEIVSEMNYSRRQCFRYHDEAIAQLNK